jgi:hypothetical protein
MRSPNLSASTRLAWTLFVSALATACVTETPELEGKDREYLERAVDYKSFPKINTQPYASGLKGMINVYVSPEGAAAYAARLPSQPDQAAPIPEGTLIVREVLDGQGTVGKLTMMAKGPRGYQPALGDWWFGVTDADLVPLYGEETWEIGRMPACHGCHVPHASDDFLFGVPAEMH